MKSEYGLKQVQRDLSDYSTYSPVGLITCEGCIATRKRLTEAEALLRSWVPEYDCGTFCGGDCKRSQLLDRTRTFLEASE